jgi:hypothetical protein
MPFQPGNGPGGGGGWRGASQHIDLRTAARILAIRKRTLQHRGGTFTDGDGARRYGGAVRASGDHVAAARDRGVDGRLTQAQSLGRLCIRQRIISAPQQLKTFIINHLALKFGSADRCQT